MSDQDIFPEMSAEDILASVEKAWDFSGPGHLPMPRFDQHCPVCRNGDWHPRYWRFFVRRSGEVNRVGHRCDVSFKCTFCSLVFTFGIAIPSWVYDAAPAREKQLWWRDVKHIIFEAEGADRFEEIQVDSA